MDTVKVSRSELLSKLKDNRQKHNKLFQEALGGYRVSVIEEMTKNLEIAQAGGALMLHIALQAPQDHTEDYDDIIAMIEMSVEDTIELQTHDFQSYVLDKWTWAKQAQFLNSTYAVGGKVASRPILS